MRWLRVSVIFLGAFAFILTFSILPVFPTQEVAQRKQVNSEPGASSFYTFSYRSEGRRDPFVPLVSKEEKKEMELETKELETEEVKEYDLIGLVWDAKEAFAIIKRKDEKWIVKEGDVVSNFQVVSVEGEKGEVILKEGHRLIKLTIRG